MDYQDIENFKSFEYEFALEMLEDDMVELREREAMRREYYESVV